ncbi:hypothetical protein DXA38_21275 [[Clostridium] innocuum]|uniref:Uncharacterized protein n=1 Tax=Clostridium innocuum TaxID=1522 RepID=A0A3E2VEH4_CLOIN|nr:hypothetical protein DXA38_21275 [[Clostridium] innocuum]RHV57972.1 hypothetical protein DXB22_21230 [Clostridiaceae bacterium OM02-2AC]
MQIEPAICVHAVSEYLHTLKQRGEKPADTCDTSAIHKDDALRQNRHLPVYAKAKVKDQFHQVAQ